MFFSGNDRPDLHEGHWRTGLAIARRPMGPFYITHRAFPFLNGGTIWDGQHFYQAASETQDQWRGAIYRSRTAERWTRLVSVPTSPGWSALRTDFYLQRRRYGLGVYFAGRRGFVGADIGVTTLRASIWSPARIVLRRRPGSWEGFDLGEPAVFRARSQRYLLYAGMARDGGPRRVGLAHWEGSRWQRCGRPFIRLSRHYPQNAIDPEPLVEDGRLYVYFGGGERASAFGAMNGTIWVRAYALAAGNQAGLR
jgi:hypothetical protein